MFKVLVAEKLEGAFKRIAVVSPRKNGTFAVPRSMQGELSAAVTRNAIRQFVSEPGATSIDVEIGTQAFRITRFQ